MPQEDTSQTGPTPDGVGYQRLRETVEKIRAGLPRDDQHPATTSLLPATAPAVTPIAQIVPVQRGRPKGSREDRDHISAYLQDFHHELGDEAPLSSSVTRALNIFTRAHIPPEC